MPTEKELSFEEFREAFELSQIVQTLERGQPTLEGRLARFGGEFNSSDCAGFDSTPLKAV